MPVGPEEFSARVAAAADDDGRLPLPDTSMAGWETFPFESDGLLVRPLQHASFPEAPRLDENPGTCRACERADEAVWRHERWGFVVLESGAPLVLMLQPRAHHDLSDLPDELAAELGVITTHLVRHVEALPHVARCHVMRIGDGGAHLHVFFFARPEGYAQLRGSFLAVWDDLLPRVPQRERDTDARAVGHALAASFGGHVID